MKFGKLFVLIGLVLIPQMGLSDDYLSTETAIKLVKSYVLSDVEEFLHAENSVSRMSMIPMYSNYEKHSSDIMFTMKKNIGEIKLSQDPEKIELVSEKHPEPGKMYLTGQTGFPPPSINSKPMAPVSVFVFYVKKQALAIVLATYSVHSGPVHQVRYMEFQDLSQFQAW